MVPKIAAFLIARCILSFRIVKCIGVLMLFKAYFISFDMPPRGLKHIYVVKEVSRHRYDRKRAKMCCGFGHNLGTPHKK